MDEFRCNWHDCDNFQLEDSFYCDIHDSRIEPMSLSDKEE